MCFKKSLVIFPTQVSLSPEQSTLGISNYFSVRNTLKNYKFVLPFFYRHADYRIL
jgi:hypothetical protein